MAVTDKLRGIANAIRKKTGTSDLMKLDEMDDLITTISGDELPDYQGSCTIKPSFEQTILQTDETILRDNITIEPISVDEVSNSSNGKTLII